MSGPEVVLSLIAGIITILEAVEKVYSAVTDASGLPEAFRDVACGLPLVKNTLNTAVEHLNTVDQQGEVYKTLKPTVDSCEDKAKRLEKLFRNVGRQADASIAKRSFLAVRTLGKGSQVKMLMEGILKDVQLISCSRIMELATKEDFRQLVSAERLPNEEEDCLRSLGFPSLYTRREDILPAHQHTCDWLFKTAEFQEWRGRGRLETHNGVLWIKGNPGAGKSTLMKHALHYCQKNFKDHLVIAHFFNARGQTIEKSPVGMLRSIVYQLAKEDATVCEHFVPIFREKQMINRGTEWEWRQRELQDFLLSAIKDWKSKPLLILVDALDECDTLGKQHKEVRAVVQFLESLSICAVNARVSLRILLSSRHYPTVGMGKHLEFTVETSTDHGEDIARYITESLRGDDNTIEAQIREIAAGIFMWVVLVVSLLNQAYDEGRPEEMQEILDGVPDDLEELLNALLSNDIRSKDETISMLQWVLLCEEQLKPEELYFAVMAATAPENMGTWKRSSLTDDAIRRRITTSSKGLIEVRKGDKTSVQFIHLSVNDFLLRNKRLQKLDPTLEQPDPISASHGRLWKCCRQAIEQASTTLTTKEHMRNLNGSYPFLRYAATHIFHHAEGALSAGAMQKEIALWLQQRHVWFDWWKTVLTTSNEDSSWAADMGAGDMGTGLLYFFSARGYQSLVKDIIFEEDAEVNAQGGVFGNALQAASARGRTEIAAMLLARGAEVNAQGGRYGNALQAASAHGSTEIAAMLVARGAEVNAQGGEFGNALQAASFGGSTEIATMLVARGAEVNAQGGHYGNALQAASAHGRTEIATMLVARGAEVNAQGGQFGNALQAASFGGSTEIATMLVARGAEVNAQGSHYGNALQAASVGGRTEIAAMLLARGAEVNAQGGRYGNALQAASAHGRTEIAAMLLARGAVNT